jgi:hypothetical protein
MWEKMMNDPKVKEKAAEMMRDPAQMNAAMATLASSLQGGNGMTGMLLRNSPIKGMIDKLGGVENLEKMMKDPRVSEMLDKTMNDPAAMARVAKQMQEVMGQKDQLAEKK